MLLVHQKKTLMKALSKMKHNSLVLIALPTIPTRVNKIKIKDYIQYLQEMIKILTLTLRKANLKSLGWCIWERMDMMMFFFAQLMEKNMLISIKQLKTIKNKLKRKVNKCLQNLQLEKGWHIQTLFSINIWCNASIMTQKHMNLI